MFNIGDVIIYSEHGLSVVEDICEKTFADETKQCYVLQPLDESNLTIITPVDNDKVMMSKLIEREEAEAIIQSFHQPGIDWIEDAKRRPLRFQEIIKSGDRLEIAKIANTLMRKSIELSLDKKKLYEQDRRMLEMIQNILFKEIALALESDYEKICQRIEAIIQQDYAHA